ncbi:hypothetical protein ACMFMG_011623 [Clarireedia jacksonii]
MYLPILNPLSSTDLSPLDLLNSSLSPLPSSPLINISLHHHPRSINTTPTTNLTTATSSSAKLLSSNSKRDSNNFLLVLIPLALIFIAILLATLYNKCVDYRAQVRETARLKRRDEEIARSNALAVEEDVNVDGAVRAPIGSDAASRIAREMPYREERERSKRKGKWKERRSGEEIGAARGVRIAGTGRSGKVMSGRIRAARAALALRKEETGRVPGWRVEPNAYTAVDSIITTAPAEPSPRDPQTPTEGESSRTEVSLSSAGAAGSRSSGARTNAADVNVVANSGTTVNRNENIRPSPSRRAALGILDLLAIGFVGTTPTALGLNVGGSGESGNGNGNVSNSSISTPANITTTATRTRPPRSNSNVASSTEEPSTAHASTPPAGPAGESAQPYPDLANEELEEDWALSIPPPGNNGDEAGIGALMEERDDVGREDGILRPPPVYTRIGRVEI